jgi:hypothetical protein
MTDMPRRMKGSHVAISAAVAALCAGILVLFTDIEISMVRWFSCGPFSTQGEERSEVCQRKL